MQGDGYDTYCTHPDCVAHSDAFFNYTSNNRHVLDHIDHVTPIHPMALQSVIRAHNQEQFNTFFRNRVSQIIHNSINQTNKQITKFLQDKFFSYFAQQLVKKVECTREIDVNDLIRRLKVGDIDLVRKIVTLKSQKGLSFLNIIGTNQQEQLSIFTQEQIAPFNRKMISILESAFQNAMTKEQCNLQGILIAKEPRKVRENKGIMDIRPLGSQDEEDSHSSSDYKFPKRKKQIRRRGRRSKTAVIHPPIHVSEESYLKELPNAQEVSFLRGSLLVRRCSDPQKTYRYILENYPDAQAIHIFSPTFANRNNIANILRSFRSLHTLTFNCDYQVGDLLSDASREGMQPLRTLQLKWNLRDFFKEYMVLHSFPTVHVVKLERLRKLRPSQISWNLMKDNDTLWIDNENYLEKRNLDLLTNQEYFQGIKVLHFASVIDGRMALLANLNLPPLTNLLVLNIREVDFNCGSEAKFKHLVRKNPHLTTLVIYRCQFTAKIINDCLGCLAELPALTHFSLDPRHKALVLHPSVITSLTNIQSLHMTRVIFSKDNEANSKCLANISKLKKLKHLELYACGPIFDDFFSYLDEQVLSSLEFLSIGHTSVTGRSTSFLARMVRLQYLNIDSLELDGAEFLQICHDYQLLYGKKWPLKYLSIQEFSQKNLTPGMTPLFRFSLQQMQEIAKLLPSLQYLNIALCQNLKSFDFGLFRSLETVAVDSELNKALRGRGVNLNRFVI